MIYITRKSKILHQFSDKSLPASFEKCFIRTTVVHRHSTRTPKRNHYFLQHFSTSRLLRLIKFSEVKIQNSIPYKFKNLSFKKFILEYKLNLINQYKWLNLNFFFLFRGLPFRLEDRNCFVTAFPSQI